jgi:hypothetical protein
VSHVKLNSKFDGDFMATITFDTFKFAKKLEKAGLPQEQAEAIAEAFKEDSAEAEVATKRDVEHLVLK